MDPVQVLDTGVLLAIAVSQDQHHEKCLNHVVSSNNDSFMPPAAKDEFKSKIKDIQDGLSQEIKRHRRQIVREYRKSELDRSDLVNIRENILETDFDSHRFLYDYYEYLKPQCPVELDTLTTTLSNMATEVYYDGAKEHGGFTSLISAWTKGIDPYPNVEKELLIHEGDDPKICVQAHHIATSIDDTTELCTVNPNHFNKKLDGEPVSREENILEVTNLDDVVDLSMSKYP